MLSAKVIPVAKPFASYDKLKYGLGTPGSIMLFSKTVLASETGSTGGGGFLMLSFLQEMATKKNRVMKYGRVDSFMVCACVC